MRYSYDNGIGGTTGRWLSIHFGPGKGYMRHWWTDRNRGPGNATAPGLDCGHRGPDHCWSKHCRRTWCGAHRWPILGWLIRGHTLRLWCGPRYGTLRAGLFTLRRLRQARAVNDGLYSVASFN